MLFTSSHHHPRRTLASRRGLRPRPRRARLRGSGSYALSRRLERATNPLKIPACAGLFGFALMRCCVMRSCDHPKTRAPARQKSKRKMFFGLSYLYDTVVPSRCSTISSRSVFSDNRPVMRMCSSSRSLYFPMSQSNFSSSLSNSLRRSSRMRTLNSSSSCSNIF